MRDMGKGAEGLSIKLKPKDTLFVIETDNEEVIIKVCSHSEKKIVGELRCRKSTATRLVLVETKEIWIDSE